MGIARLLIPLGILPEKLSTSISERVCHGSNTWEYTKLGHINLSKDEIINLIGNKNVIVTLELK